MNISESQVDATISQLAEGKITVEEAVGHLLESGVKVGDTVAVVADPTYPFDGIKGVVRSINGGSAEVEFPNGTKAQLQSSLLVTV